MQTDFYRSWEPLLAPTHLARGPLLVLTPHPDDEVIGACGLILGHRDTGHDVVCAVMTDGCLGDAGAAHGGEDYIALRKAECRAASEVLGGTDVRFLDFADGSLREHLASPAPEPVERLVALLGERTWGTIAFPSPYELHPDHRATAIAGLMAVQRAGISPILLAYEVGSFMPSNLLINVSDYFDRKRRALESYTSQLEHHDLVKKVEGLNVARSANVPDPAVTHCEAYLRIDAARAPDFLSAVEGVLRITDEMTPPVPYE